jgi:hypothetical protein
MIEAFQEQLVTLDELRSRMPDLRARESNLRGQLAALDASIADRDAYLKLADNLEGTQPIVRLVASAIHPVPVPFGCTQDSKTCRSRGLGRRDFTSSESEMIPNS